MKKIFIFDLDGTILDNYDAIEKSLLFSLNKNGVQISSENMKKYFGFRLEELVDKLVPKNITRRRQIIEKCVDDYKKFYGKIHLRYTRLRHGIKSTLSNLNQKGILVVASNKPYPVVMTSLKHFKLIKYFKHIFSSYDSKRPKPHPDMLLDIINTLNVRKSDCLHIGDSIVDIIAGRKAGIKTVCIENPHIYAQKYGNLRATDNIIIKLGDLRNWCK